MKLCALKATGTIAKIGNTKNAATNATNMFKVNRPFIGAP